MTITDIIIKDVRFPTSKTLDGSDAMNTDPDYSAAYVILQTDHSDFQGHGLTFTIGRGNELCTAAIASLAPLILNTKFFCVLRRRHVFDQFELSIEIRDIIKSRIITYISNSQLVLDQQLTSISNSDFI